MGPESFAGVEARLLTAGVCKWKDNTTEGDSFYFLDPDGHKLEIHSTDLHARVRSAKKVMGRRSGVVCLADHARKGVEARRSANMARNSFATFFISIMARGNGPSPLGLWPPFKRIVWIFYVARMLPAILIV